MGKDSVPEEILAIYPLSTMVKNENGHFNACEYSSSSDKTEMTNGSFKRKDNRMRRPAVWILVLVTCMAFCVFTLADVLNIPESVTVIEEEAFFGDTSMDEVVLPEGVEKICKRAFAESSVSSINLPDSLTEIADDAFDLDAEIEFTANEGSYAYEWLKKV